MTVDAASFTLTNAMKGQAIDLTPSTGNGTAVTVISYTDKSQHVPELTWDVTFIGKNNGDDLLEQDEQAVIRVDLSIGGSGHLTTSPGTYDTFTIEVKPVTGASLILNRTLPAKIDPVMNLH
jgi:archaellin